MKKYSRAFSLIELMVTLVIASILIGLAIPSFQDLIKNNRIASTTNEFIGAFNFARSEAVNRGARVHLGILDATKGNESIVVWIDGLGGESGKNKWDANEELRVWKKVPTGIAVKSKLADELGPTTFIFDSSGMVNTEGDVTITVCGDRADASGNAITLLKSGATYIDSVDCT